MAPANAEADGPGGWKADGPDEPGRSSTTQAVLTFAQGGGRTFLARQSVPYPFHITRPHYLDDARPDLATLYMQSASGGLYRGDRLRLAVTARPGVAAHVTSQAATVVHRAAGSRIGIETHVTVHPSAVLALTTDPYILFPQTTLAVATEVVLHRGAALLLADGFAAHDPAGAGAPFTRFSTATRVRTADGRVLVDDRSHLSGTAFTDAASPLGPYCAAGSAMLFGPVAGFDPARIEAVLDTLGVLAGVSPLPNDAGWGLRLLARDGGQLARGLDDVFTLAFQALLGCAPARRRK